MDLRMPSPTSNPLGKLVEKPLAQMGYRPYNGSNNLFAKVVGYVLLVFDVNALTLSALYGVEDCKVKVWKSVDINEENDILMQIKHFEAHEVKYDFGWSENMRDFSFLSISEQLGFIL